ncbi:MAG: hypothetical protein FJ276_34080, partial [Planctomycetes bacterium]|nr:hypothetical protein [Planctomycetota bacterium]
MPRQQAAEHVVDGFGHANGVGLDPGVVDELLTLGAEVVGPHVTEAHVGRQILRALPHHVPADARHHEQFVGDSLRIEHLKHDGVPVLDRFPSLLDFVLVLDDVRPRDDECHSLGGPA